jgi:hypothetical protein
MMIRPYGVGRRVGANHHSPNNGAICDADATC